MSPSFWIRRAVLAAIGLGGGAVLLFATRHGIGISPDSMDYVGAARNLLAGRGVTLPYQDDVPLTFFPPFFPILLWVTGVFGADPLEGARWLQATLLAGNAVLVGALIHRFTGGSLAAAAWGALLVVGTRDTLRIHSFAWTEPAFIFLMLVGIRLLASHVARGRPPLLLGAAVAIGLAFLTRYVGAALVPAGVLGIILLGGESLRSRARDALVFGVVSCLPMALWLVRNARVGSPTGRELAFHPVTSGHWALAGETLVRWLLPVDPALSAALLAVAAAAGLWLALSTRRRRNAPPGTHSGRGSTPSVFLKLLAIFVVTYAAFLVFSISFIDVNTPLDTRILSPVFVGTLVLIGCAAGRRLTAGARGLVLAATSALALWTALQLVQSSQWAVQSHAEGLGYLSRTWRASELVEQVRALPAGIPIYSNAPAPVYILAGRGVRPVPLRRDPTTGRRVESYPDNLANIRQRLETRGGVVVYFYRFGFTNRVLEPRLWMPAEGELERALGLRRIVQTADGAILAPREADGLVR